MHNDWKKQAATQVDDNQIEKAFLDQAYTYIANKARAIMQPPYRLGFEVVYKNDDNTRMVGIFAFRIAKDLYYAPVFFLNGDIKGHDLLYRHTTKTFVPLTAEWIQYLLDSDVSVMGRPITRQQTMQIPQYMNLQRLVRPDYGTGMKSASATDEAAASKAFWEEFFKSASEIKVVGPALKDFIIEDGGLSALNLLTNAMEQSVKFANALYSLLPEDVYMPEIQVQEKKAAFTKRASVILHREFGPSVKVASEDFHSKGYWFEDLRKEAAIVYEEPGEMQTVGEPGIYEITLKGGGVMKAFAARHTEERIGVDRSGSSSWREPDPLWQLVRLDTKEVIQDIRKAPLGFAERENEKTGEEPSFMLKEPTVGKGYVIFDTGSGILSEPFKVCEIKDVDGLKRMKVCQQYHCNPSTLVYNPDYKAVKLGKGVIGTDARFIEVKMVEEYDTPRFPCDCVPGDREDLDWYIYNAGMKSASVQKFGEEFRVRTGRMQVTDSMDKLATVCHLVRAFELRPDAAEELVEKAASGNEVRFCYEWPAEVQMKYLTKRAFLGLGKKQSDPGYESGRLLYSDMSDAQRLDAIRAYLAGQVPDPSKFKGGSKDKEQLLTMLPFLQKHLNEMRMPSVPDMDEEMEADIAAAGSKKQARAVMMQAEPQYDPSFDPRFGTMVDPQPQYTVGTEYIPEPVPQQRIGDAWDPSMQSQFLTTATPEQLADMAQQMQLPNIFEHGVVGQLVKTYDSSALIQKYIPKLEDALDCLGRLLFLLYWKPQDFKQLYGADDLAAKESEILSSFRQFGDLVLSLVKMSKPQQTGNAVSV